MNFSETVRNYQQRTQNIQRSIQTQLDQLDGLSCYGFRVGILIINSHIGEQRQLLVDLKHQSIKKLLNEFSLHSEIHDFELTQVLTMVSHIRTSVKQITQQIADHICKINKMTEKFFSHSYDFTERQQIALKIYFLTICQCRKISSQDFDMICRIVQIHFDSYDAHTTTSLGIRCFFALLDLLRVSGKRKELTQLISKYQPGEVIYKFAYKHIGNVNAMLQSAELMINYLYSTRRLWDIKFPEEGFNPQTLKPNIHSPNRQQYAKFTSEMFEQLVKLIDPCISIINSASLHQQTFIYVITFISGLTTFKHVKFEKSFENHSLLNMKYVLALKPAQELIGKVLYNSKIMETIMKVDHLWRYSPKNAPHVLTIFELIVPYLTITEFKDKYLLLLEFFLSDQNQSVKSNTLVRLINFSKKPDNSSVFREVFVQTQLFDQILNYLDKQVNYLEQNPVYAPKKVINIREHTEFIFKTILVIEIWKACKMSQIKLISKSAEIVLNLGLNCYWLNVYMEEFLAENPIDANEKMEIEG